MEEKRKLLDKIDEEILALCDVKDIPAEIDESADVVARILKPRLKSADIDARNQRKRYRRSSENNVSNSLTLLNTSTIENVNNGSSSTVGGGYTGHRNLIQTKLPKLSVAKFKGEITK